MSSLNSILSIARSAVSAQQTVIQTISENISNVSTDGYSRQRADLVALPSLVLPQGSLGTGVTVAGITRARDEALDVGYREEASNAAGAGVRHDTLSAVEGVLNEPSDSGLSAALDAFWSSWSDLANQPSSPAAQSVVRQRGDQVARLLNGYAQQLDEQRTQAEQHLDDSVKSLNQLSTQVAELDRRIVAAEAGGQQAPDLRDARDRFVDQMADLAGIRVVTGDNGRFAITLGGATLVDGDAAKALALGGTAVAPAVTLANNTTPLTALGGTLGALLQVTGTDLPSLHGSLDTIAQALVTGVNAIHRTGATDASPAGGVDFFDATPSNATAKNITLSDAVKASPAVIAAGTSPGGDNAVALDIAALRDRTGTATLQQQYGVTLSFGVESSYGDAYRQVVSDLGVSVSAAGSDAGVYDTLKQQADARRTSVSGVSLDEELTRLMEHQQAYAAASKLVVTADEMAQAVLDMVR